MGFDCGLEIWWFWGVFGWFSGCFAVFCGVFGVFLDGLGDFGRLFLLVRTV